MIAVLLMAASVQSYAFTTLGEGTMSCGEWIDDRKANPGRVLPQAGWVSGYVTAMAKMDSARTGREIAKGIGGSGLDHWVDNYCAAHPLANVEAAASALVDELKSQGR